MTVGPAGDDDAFAETMATLYTMPTGAAQVDGFAEAVRRADAAGDRDRAHEARWGLLEAAVGAGLVGDDHVLPTFAWLLADFDARSDAAGPDRTAQIEDLLGAYVVVLRYATRYPQIPRARVESLLADFAARSAACGGHPADVLETRLHAEADLGNLRAVPGLCGELVEARRRAGLPRAWGDEALAAVYTGQTDRALAAMRPVLQDPDLCPPDRANFRTWALRPLVWAGATGEATGYYVAVRDDRSVGPFGRILVLEYAARLRDLPAVAKLTRAALPGAERMSPDMRSQVYQAAGLGLAVLAAADDRPLRLPLPAELFPAEAADAPGGARVRPSAAAGPLLAGADRIAAAFDARNGNGITSQHLTGNRRFVLGDGTPEAPGDPLPGVDRVPDDLRDELARVWGAAG